MSDKMRYSCMSDVKTRVTVVITLHDIAIMCFFFFSSRRRHTRCGRDWSSDVCSSDLSPAGCFTKMVPAVAPKEKLLNVFPVSTQQAVRPGIVEITGATRACGAAAGSGARQKYTAYKATAITAKTRKTTKAMRLSTRDTGVRLRPGLPG